MTERTLTKKDLAYDAIHDSWQNVISNYDTQRRVEVLVDEWLAPLPVSSFRVLEVGAGLGYFSARLYEKTPAELTVTDLAPALVEKLSHLLPDSRCRVADAMNLAPALGDQTFDLVFSSEVVEHTPEPRRSVIEMCQRVAPNGYLVISCPNRRWIFLLWLAQRLGIRRHYQGYENWVRPSDLVQWIESQGLRIERREGIHTVPWHFLPNRILRFIDQKLRRRNYSWALNLAVMARRAP